jgi:hypothetical protein
MPKIAASQQKGSNKKHTSITAAIASQSRARRSAVATAKKNRGRPRKKLSHQQATQTRDLLDAEFRDLRVKVSNSFRPQCCIASIWRRVLICLFIFLPSDIGAAGGAAAA